MEIAAELLNEEMHEIVAAREASWSRPFAEAVKRVNRSFAIVEKAALGLGEATRRAWGTLTRPMEQHGLRLSEQVIELCRPLTIQKPGNSYDVVKDYEERSAEASRSIAKIYNKYAGSVIRSTKPATSTLEDSIMSLNRNVLELTRILDGSRLKEIKGTAAEAERLVQNVDRLRLTIEELAMKRKALQDFADRGSELQNKLTLMSKGQELDELDRIEVQIRQKEAETLALVEPLSKPLRKIDRPEVKLPSGLNRGILHSFVENAMHALMELPVAEIHEALHSLDLMIDDGDLMLDERRKRKAKKTIEGLQAGLLERLREDYSILQANRQEVLRQLRASGLHERWSKLREQVDKIEIDKIRCRNDIVGLESQEAQQRSLVIAQKTALENTLARLLDEKVSIALSF